MGRGAWAYALILVLALAGCGKDAAPSSEYEIALRESKSEFLEECVGLGEKEGTAVGDLLQDFTNLAAIAAECRARHNAAVQYFKPLVDKAKATKNPP